MMDPFSAWVQLCTTRGRGGDKLRTRPRVTVEMLGREKEFYDEVVDVQAFGQPWSASGEYSWSVDSGTCFLSSKAGKRINVSRTEPGTVRLKVTYSIGSDVSEPAYHTIRFVAYPVYVIGGGAAGLKAAEHLLAAGYKVVLCEATGRLGGRARTVDAVNGAFKVDLGCQWLHGDEWRWELEQKHIPSAGFLSDDQRDLCPQLNALWPWPEDVATALQRASSAVEEAMERVYDDAAASTHVEDYAAQNEFPPDEVNEFYTTRRAEWAAQELDRLVALQRAQSRLAARDQVLGPAVRLQARALARAKYTKVNPGAYTQQATTNVGTPASGNVPRLIAHERARLCSAESKRLGVLFDQGGPNIDELVEGEMAAAGAELEALALAQIEAALREQLTQGVENQFDVAHEANFAELCRLAYEIFRAREGPLEEAAEWNQFCNFDRDAHAGLGTPTEAGCGVQQSDSNAWYLGGYGGLIESYGEHLKRTYGAKLWIRLNTAVSRIQYGAAEQVLTIRERGHDAPTKASAVVVTVSTGVVNAGSLVFQGTGAAAVTQDYGRLPMGNYKKVVLVFDRNVARVAAPNALSAATHRGTSVYWHLDNNGQLWKFLVPDVDRRIVITIVGGALANTLDAGAVQARQGTVAALQAAGVITAHAQIVEEHISTWMTEPEFRGAYSYTAIGGGGARDRLIAQPLIGYGVALAGEALFVSYGTAHGAYISGFRAAKRVHATLPRFRFDTAANMD